MLKAPTPQAEELGLLLERDIRAIKKLCFGKKLTFSLGQSFFIYSFRFAVQKDKSTLEIRINSCLVSRNLPTWGYDNRRPTLPYLYTERDFGLISTLRAQQVILPDQQVGRFLEVKQFKLKARKTKWQCTDLSQYQATTASESGSRTPVGGRPKTLFSGWSHSTRKTSTGGMSSLRELASSLKQSEDSNFPSGGEELASLAS